MQKQAPVDQIAVFFALHETGPTNLNLTEMENPQRVAA